MSRSDRIRTWVLIVLVIAMALAGLLSAINRFTYFALIPMLVGVIAVLFGARVLTRKRRSN